MLAIELDVDNLEELNELCSKFLEQTPTMELCSAQFLRQHSYHTSLGTRVTKKAYLIVYKEKSHVWQKDISG